MKNTEFKEIAKRIARLERAVFGSQKKRTANIKDQTFAGPSGGVRLLVSQNFFKAKRSLGDTRDALAKNDYHYGAAQIQTALNRFSTRKGPLAASNEGGKKLYVNRK